MIKRLCPYCEFTLMERTVNEDGTVTYSCPECGWTGSLYDLKHEYDREEEEG